MDTNEQQKVILEQYRTYSEAKEKFIDRHFANNKFYLVLNIIILVTSYILSTLTPSYQPTLILSGIGVAISILWWMSIDSYQILIKVKYSKVLEYLETKLPEQPYAKEFIEYKQMKKSKNLIVFGDLQKFLALIILCIYSVIFIYNCTILIRFQML